MLIMAENHDIMKAASPARMGDTGFHIRGLKTQPGRAKCLA